MKRWGDDPFTKKAKRENFAARSVYKLEEIDRREKILGGAKHVLDLGAAPGSWSQYVLQACPEAKIIAVDLQPLSFSNPRVEFTQGDLETLDWMGLLAGRSMDVVLSDMAPKTTGVAATDTARSHNLAQLALHICGQTLVPGGNFVVKLFMGPEFEEFRAELRGAFDKVSLLRPDSTRKHSREIFFIGKGHKRKQS